MDVRDSRGRFAANALSFMRIPLAGLLWVMPHQPVWVLSMLGLAGLTDVLDGWVLRHTRSRRWTEHDPGAYSASVTRGEFIDGFADKVFVVSAVSLLAYVLRPAPWVLALIVSRELLLVPLLVVYQFAPERLRSRVDFTAGVPGKAATIAQFVALVLGVVNHPLFVEAAVVAGVLGAFAVFYYVTRVRKTESR